MYVHSSFYRNPNSTDLNCYQSAFYQMMTEQKKLSPFMQNKLKIVGTQCIGSQASLGSLEAILKAGQEKELFYGKTKKKQNKIPSLPLMSTRRAAEILYDATSNQIQLKAASKTIVNQIFVENYGADINTLIRQLALPEPLKPLGSIQKLQQLLISQKPNQRNSLKPRHEEIERLRNASKIVLRKQALKNIYVPLDPEVKLKQLQQLKGQYSYLRKIAIPEKHQDGDLFIEGILQEQKREDILDEMMITYTSNMTLRNQPFAQYKKRHTVDNKSEIFINENNFCWEGINALQPQLMMYLCHKLDMAKLRIVKLFQIRIHQQMLFFFLQCLERYCSKKEGLNQLWISSIAVDDVMGLSHRLCSLLAVLPIREAIFNYLDIGSQQFCTIMLGAASNLLLREISFQHNRIDRLCLNMLSKILRACPQLDRLGLEDNNIKPYMFKHHIVKL